MSEEVPVEEKNDGVSADESTGEEVFQGGIKQPQTHDTDDKFFQFLTGIKTDLRTRAPYYASDWGRPTSYTTVINAIFYAFVVQLIPALIFADRMDTETDGHLGTAETLLSAGIIGVIYAVISGQPLVLLGITGPVAMLLGTSYKLAEQFESQYWPFFWWLCMWTAILHFATAIFGLVNFVWHISPFTTQIFEFFIASSFIYESISDLVIPLHLASADYDNRGPAYANLVIGMLAFSMCWRLHFAETWTLFPRQVRVILSSYNMAIVTVIVTALSYLPGANQLDSDGKGIQRVNVIPQWGWPSVDRSWLINPAEGIGTKGIFGALFPAFMLYLLFFIDHNISSILTQAPKYNLQKPAAYHWDFFCLGLTIVPCGMLGLPPGSGLIPQAPLHTRALATRKIVEKYGIKQEVTVHVEEQRWSAFMQAALMFVVLNLFVILSWIPKGSLYGIFLYLGVQAMHGNEIFNIITLSLMYAEHRPPIPIVANVKWSTALSYTLIQVSCTAAIFGVANFASVGYIFPALIGLLVPIRSYIISRLFSEEDLKYLDPIDLTEDEAHDEKVMLMSRIPSAGGEDEVEATVMPGFGDFHAKGMKKDIQASLIARRSRRDAVNDEEGWEQVTSAESSSTLTKRYVASKPAEDNT